MIKADDFNYAMENTRVVIPPTHAIQTYGQTSFRFRLVTEPMDETGSLRLRSGMIHAERPRPAPCTPPPRASGARSASARRPCR